MQSKIIKKLLNENNPSLSIALRIVKKNSVFQKVMSDIKDEFFINDNIHGISHNERVTFLACYIGILEKLSNDLLRLVLEAAKYHDIGRNFEGNHGKYSTILIDRNKEYIFPDLNDEQINIIKALCHGHSVDDKKYKDIAQIYGIENIEQFKLMLDILKDADALDRVRLPRYGQLDEKYLRTETSKQMIEIANSLFSSYNIAYKKKSEVTETQSNYVFHNGLRENLLYDGKHYYLLRSLNTDDIRNFDSGNGIHAKLQKSAGYSIQDVMSQVRMQHRKTNLISMSEDPNIVLTYDRSNLHRFVLIQLSQEEIENSNNVFSVGEYLLGVMDSVVESLAINAPRKVKQLLENIDNSSSVEEIVKIINGADRQVPTSLIETEQQYLTPEEQFEQSKKIAKCKVLHYYGLMRGIAYNEKGALLNISEFSQIMRIGYSSSEWLYSGKIEQKKIINISPLLVDALALVKQAKFQGKDKETLNKIEQVILRLALSGAKLNQDIYKIEYSAHDNLKDDLSIYKAFELTDGKISYRDTNMQQIAIRSLAEMTLNKRKIIQFIQSQIPDVDVANLLSNTYCINQEMITRQNKRGNQFCRNVNFIISNYGYDFDDKTSAQIFQTIDKLRDSQLVSIISEGVNSPELPSLLILTRSSDNRIQSNNNKEASARYITEAIIEGYNWKKDGNTLTEHEKTLLANTILKGVVSNEELNKLYKAINSIQINNHKFSQNEVFAIIINLSIDGKIGNLSYSKLLKKDFRTIQLHLLKNKEYLQTSVLPISIDLLAKRGKSIDKLKNELIDLGISKEFIEQRAIKNVYIAKQIVEGYEFERELNKTEKRALIQSILDISVLHSPRSRALISTLIQNMKLIGLGTQEIYGMIINLGVNGIVLEETGFGYSDLLVNRNHCLQTIGKYKNKIQTRVTIETIQRALKNVNLERRIFARDIAMCTMELLADGSGGSRLCDDVQDAYNSLLHSIEELKIEGSE